MTEPTFTIIGAGLAGSLMAIYAARRGFPVVVYERRDDPRTPGTIDAKRSINLGLSERGLRALREVDLLETPGRVSKPPSAIAGPDAAPDATAETPKDNQYSRHSGGDARNHPAVSRLRPPAGADSHRTGTSKHDLTDRIALMRGRVVHHPDGGLSFQAYGTSEEQILRSVLRSDLNAALISRAEDLGVKFCFDTRLHRLDLDRGVAFVGDDELAVPAEVVIGADGVHSLVRQAMGCDTDEETLEWGYREVYIPAGEPGDQRTDPDSLHVWPGEHGLIVAHPNVDGSLTGTVFLPHEGPVSFRTLDVPAKVRDFFATNYPDALTVMPDLVEEFLAHPVGSLHTIRTAPWQHGGRAVLLGDAAHAVYPFYGQGMNSSFEDCSVLDACIAAHPGDLARAFAEFQHRRKRHTDVLAELSKQNFVELRDRVGSPLYAARKRADLALNRLLGDRWMPLYTMVSHTTVPYADALARARRQDRVLTLLAAGVVSATALAVFAAFRRGFSRGDQC